MIKSPLIVTRCLMANKPRQAEFSHPFTRSSVGHWPAHMKVVSKKLIIALRLQGEQMSIAPAQAHELLMRSLLRDLALL